MGPWEGCQPKWLAEERAKGGLRGNEGGRKRGYTGLSVQADGTETRECSGLPRVQGNVKGEVAGAVARPCAGLGKPCREARVWS